MSRRIDQSPGGERVREDAAANQKTRKAMDTAEQLYRLADQMPPTETGRLARQLVDAAAELPVQTALADRAPMAAEAALLRAETVLALSVRMKALAEPQASGAFGLLAELRTLLSLPAARSAAPSSAPEGPPAPPKPAAPAARKPGKTDAAPGKPAATAPAVRGVDRIVVDGCNFLGRAPGYTLGDPASRDRLLLRLQEYAHRHPAHRVTIFFDGQRASRRVTAGVEERVTSGQSPADDVMVEFLGTLPAADLPRTTVVTDDRELGRRARGLGARVESVEWLTGRIARRPAETGAKSPQAGVSRGDLEMWEEFFRQPPKRPGKK